MALKDNLKEIHQKISAAAKRCGRNEDEITLICVSKTIDAETINEAFNLGERVFGENRVQELTEKYPLVNSDARWHLIGHLQTNKVKYVVGKAELIHSVDSLHLAKAINAQAEKQGICQKILLEVNISGEESKYGLTTQEIPTIIKEIGNMKGLSFRGFMTMAPLYAEENEIRDIFSRAKKLFDEYKPYGSEVLSMGMSQDFEIAVEEGATCVRVGRSIFKKQAEPAPISRSN